jgi:aryl-alcohol dehydrogenase-like predicted oxidoreductase
MVNRREFLGIAAGAGAALALAPPLGAARGGPELVEGPELLRAHQQLAGALIQRAIPSSGEMLPCIGLGRGSRPADPAALKEVLKTLVDNGGRIVDTTAGGSAAQDACGAAAYEMGIQNKIFWSTPLVLRGGADAVRAQVDASCARLKVPKLDLAMLVAINTTDVTSHLDVLREMKKEGRVRYIGVTDLLLPPSIPGPVAPTLVSIMRNEQIDFAGFDYSIGDRRAEETLLPLAQERKIGVLGYFTFDRGRHFTRASGTRLPEWAAEFDAKTWAQFFLKYVISHPAVTVARTGTTKAAHMLENIGGGIGRLPNEAMRKRMAALVDSLPPTQ